MTEDEALKLMVAPGTRRPGKYREGVIQILVTSRCDKSCFNCTQASQLELQGRSDMTPEQFEIAVRSLDGYFGVVGMFGGNPPMNRAFPQLCEIMRKLVPFEQRGIWSNNPLTLENARIMRETFNPRVSNLNVHMDRRAWELFKKGWPESMPVGLDRDSRHSPPFVAMKDVLRRICPGCDGEGSLMYQMAKKHSDEVGGHRVMTADEDWYYATTDGQEIGFKTIGGPCSVCNGEKVVYNEGRAWELISGCDINKHWSAMVGVFRGELRAWFCEVAGAQAILHQWDKKPLAEQKMTLPEDPVLDEDLYSYPDTGYDLGRSTSFQANRSDPLIPTRTLKWWELGMPSFAAQVRKHCHECGVPLRGHGELAQAKDGTEQTSRTHEAVYRAKSHRVELVTVEGQMGVPLGRMTDYLGNARG